MESLLYGKINFPHTFPKQSLILAGANIEMVRIDTIRESNAKCKDIHELVAVFVGGTGGIGESTAKELFLRTTKPRAYIIGR